ncbi:MAG: SEC-C domain-containing protein [Deltaproteobacteria bacterium]|nr:SEC-C domain-containing protein [Deltaproteobacteria bacterium]
MGKTGRNSPCPCGSGKKYKKCCAGKQNTPLLPTTPPPWSQPTEAVSHVNDGMSNNATDFLSIFRENIGEHAFESIDELKEVIASYNDDFNSRPLDDFLGLNSTQMQRICREPLEALDDMAHLRFADNDASYLGTPIIQIALSIMLHISKAKKLKLTAKGNLPLKVARAMYDHLPNLYELTTKSVRSEENLPELYIVRNLLKMVGIVRMERGWLMLSEEGHALLEGVTRHKNGAPLYRQLFFEYTNRFNWLLFTGFSKELGFIQHTALFDLYILHKKANRFVSEQILAQTYAKAFPSLSQKIKKVGKVPMSASANDLVTDAFGVLFIHKFCWFFGLLEQKKSDQSDEYMFKTTELFRLVLDWKI